MAGASFSGDEAGSRPSWSSAEVFSEGEGVDGVSGVVWEVGEGWAIEKVAFGEFMELVEWLIRGRLEQLGVEMAIREKGGLHPFIVEILPIANAILV